MIDWIRSKPLYEEKVSPEDLDLVVLTDDVDEACQAIIRRHEERLEKERAAQAEHERALKQAEASNDDDG
jgi:hypothetical protein